MIRFGKKAIFVLLSSTAFLASGCIFEKPTFSAYLNFSDCTLSINSGKQLSLSRVLYGNKLVPTTNYSYTWTSSNIDVVKVSQSGYVTAVNAGTADVVANIKIVGKEEMVRAICSFTVTDPNPVTITLNKSSAEIQQGKTLQLTAVVDHTANKNVVWTSDNPNITVDENGTVKASALSEIGSTATITATSAYNLLVSASCKVTVVEHLIVHTDYTIMFYMSGSTLEYDDSTYYGNYGLMSEDIKEILSVKLPDEVKIIIETGGAKKWALSSDYIDGTKKISSDRLQRWEVSNGKIKLIETLNTNKIATADSFESFLEWGINDYKADQMGVVISGHGAGIGGCAPDSNSYSDYLTISEIVEASSNALENSNKDKLDWIGFDCCMMQCADIASVMSDYFNFMVGSQESEFGQGWDHDVYLRKLALNTKISPQDLLPEIASSYVSTFESSLCTRNSPCFQTSSVLDLSKMPTLINEFNSFVSNAGTDAISYLKYQSAFKSSLNKFGEEEYGLADFKDFISKLSSEFSGISNTALLNALNDVVISNSHCSKYIIAPCGLNAFLPETPNLSGRVMVLKSDYQGNVTKFSAYQDMCLSYGSFYYSW